MPEAGPLGETFLDASALAMAEALWLNSPSSGWVESVSTFADHFFVVISGSPLGWMRVAALVRRRWRKKLVSRLPHSSASRPGLTSTRWFSCGWFMTASTEPHAPALG